MKQLARLAALALALAVPSTSIAATDNVASAGDISAVIASPARSAENRALDESRMPAEVLAFAGYKPGDVVADYLAGGGYYSEMIASVVGAEGRVYAMNPSKFFKPEVWDAIRAGQGNVIPLVAPAAALRLAPGSVDSVFAHLVYHDLYFESEKFAMPWQDPADVVANWFAAVKPGGTVVIVDHVGPRGDTRAIVEAMHRIDPEQVKDDMERGGFVLETTSDVLQRSDDDHSKSVFDPEIRGKTDRFVMKFRKTA